MKNETTQWISYWCNCLKDSMRKQIDVAQEKDNDNIVEIENFDINSTHTDKVDDIKKLIAKCQKLKGNQKNDVEQIDVLIAPFRLIPNTSHQFQDSRKRTIYPFWFPAVITKDGELKVPERRIPRIPREFLTSEKYDSENEFSQFVFSTIEAVDKALTIPDEKTNNYLDYAKSIAKLFKNIKKCDISEYSEDGYKTEHTASVYLFENEDAMVSGIIKLYKKMEDAETEAREKGKTISHPLMEKMSTIDNRTTISPVEFKDWLPFNAQHIGQMTNDYPLSYSQRKALYSLIHNSKGFGEVMAVNGPPGTGKTTFLKSVVANMVVKSALEDDGILVKTITDENNKKKNVVKGGPYMFLACSANNQAITNIIESFSKSDEAPDFHWLPNITGYAAYMPSTSIIKNAPAKLYGYNYLEKNGKNLICHHTTPGVENTDADREKSHFIADIDYAKKNLSAFIDKAQLELGKEYNNLEKIIHRLHQLLQEDQKQLFKIEKSQGFFLRLLSIIFKPTWKRRMTRKYMNAALRKIEEDAELSEEKKTEKKQKITELYKTFFNHLPEELTQDDNNAAKHNLTPFYDAFDTTIRYEMFVYAIHYWEARWLKTIIDDNDNKIEKPRLDNEQTIKKNWKLQAMLTPCFVSTFYMAPKILYYTPTKDCNDNWIEAPLYDFVDCLIVDEAGQATPEVGMATFALAKSAVVVGDVEQIEPIWSIMSEISKQNLAQFQLDNLNEYKQKGFLSCAGNNEEEKDFGGSIMRIAQNACDYESADSIDIKYDNGTVERKIIKQRGIMLKEHRRCYDEIIEYCNDLAYDGLLQAKKGSGCKDKKNKCNSLNLPPMSYVIVEDSSDESYNNSRRNVTECKAICQWIINNQERLIMAYNDEKETDESKRKKIEDIVGIVTPFRAQKDLIIKELKEAGLPKEVVEQFKLGTVHSLQGAEKPIVIFSAVYGKYKPNMFFNMGKNMLNVAVSRAKDCFIVFSGQGVLGTNEKEPSGLLAKHLQKYENNNITHTVNYSGNQGNEDSASH